MITGLFSWLCAYPALYAIVGTTLPDLEGRFLEGASGTVRSYKAAGLPNIEGRTLYQYTSYVPAGITGCFSLANNSSTSYQLDTNSTSVLQYLFFDASLSSSIYGKSTTVQPASYTVNYIIKAY